jgi:succinoglycan biosynthesis protein ExoV
MRNIYYKSPIGNFGDDLNEWLWPQIFNINEKDNSYFIGIGSILSANFISQYELSTGIKTIFGTGVRPSLKPPFKFSLDDDWSVQFLRGPLSSKFFNDKYEYISDAAYALKCTSFYDEIINSEKKYEISLMPYFRSLEFFDWEKICNDIGVNYISPCSENGIEFTLKEIALSKKLITEAMHGAIVADILRVPWHKFVLTTYYYESPYIAEFKWSDWLGSVKLNSIENSFIPFYHRKNKITKIIKKLTNNFVSVHFLEKMFLNDFFFEIIDNAKYYLSSDSVFCEINARFLDKINSVKISECL